MKEINVLEDLDAAWDEFIESLNEARAAMKDPRCFPPPEGDRNNADGYRYLLGHLHRLIEVTVQQNTDFPYLQHHPGLVSKYTIDNADCSYLYAPVEPGVMYRLTGKTAANFSHWQHTRDTSAEQFAPNYIIMEAHTVVAGDSGGIQELFDGSRVVTDKLDSKEMLVNSDGSFEVLIGSKRPAGYMGNFLATMTKKGSSLPRGDVAKDDMHAHHFVLRELFGDWENEEPLEDLYIERTDFEGEYPQSRSASNTAFQLRRLGTLVNNHMRYWTTMYGELLDPYQQSTVSDKKPGYLPVNDLYTPKANTTKRGGGQVTNAMTGGIFKLVSDQALVVEIAPSIEPEHMGFHLGNYWGESYDFANNVTSLNHLQSFRGDDGVYRYVVSAADPGIQNWLDTTGYTSGYLTLRFTFAEIPDETDLPSVNVTLVNLDQLGQILPNNTPVFSPQDRIEQLAIRKKHVSKRYRQY